MNPTLKISLKTIFGISLLSIMFYWIGFEKIFESLKRFEFIWLLPLIVIFAAIYIISAFKIKVLLDPIKKVPFLTLLRYFIVAWAIGSVVPGKIGEFSLVYFLRKEKIDYGVGMAIAILDKLISIMALAIISFIGFFLFFPGSQALYLMAIVTAGIMLALAMLMTDIGRRFMKRFMLKRFHKMFTGFGKTMRIFLTKHRGQTLSNFLLAMMKWGITALSLLVVFAGFGIRISFLTVFVITAIGAIITFIPISLSGLGTREASAIFLFTKVGVASEITASVMIILLVLTYTLSLVSFIILADKKLIFSQNALKGGRND